MAEAHRSRKTRDVLRRLRQDGWVEARRGPGDHRQYRHPAKPGHVAIDHGEPEISAGTLRSMRRLDASVSLSWLTPDEKNPNADAALLMPRRGAAATPAWSEGVALVTA